MGVREKVAGVALLPIGYISHLHSMITVHFLLNHIGGKIMMINYKQSIQEHISRMRAHRVEPELIVMCCECWDRLGKPRRFMGVPVDCDRRMRSGFEVR